jgi:uncharacterized protein with PQ loop repeat
VATPAEGRGSDLRHDVALAKSDSPKLPRDFLDKVCIIAAVAMPLTAVPQIYKLFSTGNAAGLSLWMWILYCIAIIPFLTYGFVHRVPYLVILNLLWLTVQLVMIGGIMMYS